jgi:hypothetical protein
MFKVSSTSYVNIKHILVRDVRFAITPIKVLSKELYPISNDMYVVSMGKGRQDSLGE